MINTPSFSTMLFASKLTSSLCPGVNGSACPLADGAGTLGTAAGAAAMVGMCIGTVAGAGVNWFNVVGMRGILGAKIMPCAKFSISMDVPSRTQNNDTV